MTSKQAKKAKLSKNEIPNIELANMLNDLADYEKNVNRQIFKHNAYRKVARELMTHPVKITSVEQAKKLKGVGVSIGQKIEEYLKTGKIEKLEIEKMDEDALALKELTRISGIGPAAAQELLEKGITTIEALKEDSSMLNHHQKIGLKQINLLLNEYKIYPRIFTSILRYLNDFEKRIPREEIAELEELITRNIKEIDDKFQITICGSYRRGAEDSGDFDVLITHSQYQSNNSKKRIKHISKPIELMNSIVQRLQAISFITDILASGETKFMGVCRLNSTKPFRRIDMRLIPIDQYFLGVLYFTGSDVFNVNMRKTATEKGFFLNEYSLRKLGSKGKLGKPLPIENEEDVFKYMDMPFKKPNERSE